MAVVKVPGPEAGMSDADGPVVAPPDAPADAPPEAPPDDPVDGPADGLPEAPAAAPEPARRPGGRGTDPPDPPGSADAVARPSAEAPSASADVQPAAAKPAAPSTASAAVPPHTEPFRTRRPEACAGPLRRRRAEEGVALCAVMVVQIVIAM